MPTIVVGATVKLNAKGLDWAKSKYKASWRWVVGTAEGLNAPTEEQKTRLYVVRKLYRKKLDPIWGFIDQDLVELA